VEMKTRNGSRECEQPRPKFALKTPEEKAEIPD